MYEPVVQSMLEQLKYDEVADTEECNSLDLTLRQLELLSNLVRGNVYEKYLMSHIMIVQGELQRQYNVIHNINPYV